MIQTIEARELCSESEWELVESSFSPAVDALLSSDLKSKASSKVQGSRGPAAFRRS